MRISDWSSDVCSSDLLVTGARPTTLANLDAAGSSSLPITRGVIEALRDEPDQDVLGRRLASEAALSSVLEKALLLQRTLLTGKKGPNVPANEPAARAVDPANGALGQESNNRKTELELRPQVGRAHVRTEILNARTDCPPCPDI